MAKITLAPALRDQAVTSALAIPPAITFVRMAVLMGNAQDLNHPQTAMDFGVEYSLDGVAWSTYVACTWTAPPHNDEPTATPWIELSARDVRFLRDKFVRSYVRRRAQSQQRSIGLEIEAL